MSNVMTYEEMNELQRENFAKVLRHRCGIVIDSHRPDSGLIGKQLDDIQSFHYSGFYAGISAAVDAVINGGIDIEEVKKARAADEAKD